MSILSWGNNYLRFLVIFPKIASIEGNGAAFLLFPNFNLPFISVSLTYTLVL
jgi:hypothetical protein